MATRRWPPPHRPSLPALASSPRFQGENFARNPAVVDEVRRIAATPQVSPSQLALAWVLHQGAVAVPGTRRRRHLGEDVAVTTVTFTEWWKTGGARWPCPGMFHS